MRIACGHAPRCASIPGSSLGKVHVLGKGHTPSAADLPEAEAPGEGASQARETGLAMRARVATLEELGCPTYAQYLDYPWGQCLPMSQRQGLSALESQTGAIAAPLSPVLLPDPPKLLK